MSDNWANLDGGRFLAELFQKDSVQGAFLQKIINAINKLGATLGANPVGDVQPPPAVDNLNISTSNELMQISLNHNHPVTKAISYFAEVDTNPNFTNPIVKHFGPSRSPGPFPLPSLDANGNRIPYYVRAYCQYPGSKPSRPTVFGGPLNPASIKMGGSTSMTLLASTGSGTSSPTGQQGGQGFGKAPAQPKVQGPIQVSIGGVVPVAPIVTPIVTIPVSGGDGLVHGDPIWDIDTAVVFYREDFKFFRNGSPTTTAAPVGDLAWTLGGTVGTLLHNYQNGVFPHLGWAGWDNPGTADRCSVLSPSVFFDPVPTGWPLFESPGWKMVFVFQFLAPMNSQLAPDFTQKAVYIGLNGVTDMLASSNIYGRPRIFVGLRYDTDPTAPAISDTTFHFEVVENTPTTTYTRNNTQGTVIDTGITPKDQNWYRLEISCVTAGKAILSLYSQDGTNITNQTMTVPTFTLSGTATVGKYASGLAFIPLGGAVSPWSSGTTLNISGMTGTAAAMNGTRKSFPYNGSTANTYFLLPSGSSISLVSSPYTIVGYPGFVPCMRMGNDSQATPTADLLAIWFDFWGFVWNSGLATTPLALSVDNTRWDAGS